jgi:NAD(P)H dehydrogenase (quinone)
MRVMVLFSHPVPDSYGAALHQATLESLRASGHQVDNCDLYAENFQPVMSCEERRNYHNSLANTGPVASYVERLRKAEMLVVVSPIWNFGWPAILKGFFDRVFLPDVSFSMYEGQARGVLTNISRIVVVTTYGGSRFRAFLVGDPPRKIAQRSLKAVTAFKAPVTYLAHYDMNRSTPETRARFITKVRKTFSFA